MEEQGWDDDRRIIDWLGKPHHCPPGRASPEPIDARTNHGRTDADEEEIQRRVESQRKRCERRSTSPAPVPRPLLRQRCLIPSGTCTRAGTYWSRWSDSARRTWARWSRASNGTVNHYIHFFVPFAHRFAIAQPGGRGRLGRAALGTHACLAACGAPCSKARALQMLKGTLRGPLIFGAQGSEVSTARDLSPEARSSPFATPGQK